MASVYLLHELSCLPFVSRAWFQGVSLSWTNRRSSSSYPPAENEVIPDVHQSQTTEMRSEKTGKNNASQALTDWQSLSGNKVHHFREVGKNLSP